MFFSLGKLEITLQLFSCDILCRFHYTLWNAEPELERQIKIMFRSHHFTTDAPATETQTEVVGIMSQPAVNLCHLRIWPPSSVAPMYCRHWPPFSHYISVSFLNMSWFICLSNTDTKPKFLPRSRKKKKIDRDMKTSAGPRQLPAAPSRRWNGRVTGDRVHASWVLLKSHPDGRAAEPIHNRAVLHRHIFCFISPVVVLVSPPLVAWLHTAVTCGLSPKPRLRHNHIH